MSNNKCFGSRYFIGGIVIGKGTFSQNIKGIDSRNNTFICCKKVEIKRLVDEKAAKQFANKMMVHSSLNSPYILKLHNIYKDSDYFYAILDYCDNGNLQQYVETKGFLPEKQVIGFTLQLLEGFRILRQHSIINMEQKNQNNFVDSIINQLNLQQSLQPCNILIHEKKIKISDLGSSKKISDDNLCQKNIGNPFYCAPEIQEGREYNIEADIYSLGVLIYFMLFNDIPFKGDTEVELQNNKRSEQINFNKNDVFISRQMQNFIQRLLKFNREKRITWEEIYEHPIISKNIKSDNISAEIILAPKNTELLMSTDLFSNNQTGINVDPNASANVPQIVIVANEQQPNIVDQEEVNLIEQIQSLFKDSALNVNEELPVDVNPQEEEEKRKLAEQNELKEKDMVNGIINYTHMINIYSVLITLAISFRKLSQLKINYQIPAFLVQKKLKSLNDQLLTNVKEQRNIFNMQFFEEFVKTDYYEKIFLKVLNDHLNIEKYLGITQSEAEQSYKRLNFNRDELKQEFSTTKLTSNFNESFISSLISYGDGLQQHIRIATDPNEKEILFYHAMLVYTCCKVEELFKDQLDFDFEKHKNKLLETKPEQYFPMIEQQLNIALTL